MSLEIHTIGYKLSSFTINVYSRRLRQPTSSSAAVTTDMISSPD
ncbi:MAG: hypothetical protein ABIG63_12895 [Chloroflexota bacterium]